MPYPDPSDYLMIDANSVVVNIIVWDGKAAPSHLASFTVIPQTDPPLNIGDTYVAP